MKIRCALPNAGTEINGVKFVSDGDHMISEKAVPEDVAKLFLSIPGYEGVEEENAGTVSGKRRVKNEQGEQE